MTILHSASAEVRCAIESLNAHFAWLIDHRDGAGVENLFMDDGVYDMSNRIFTGTAQIKSFYDARKSRGKRAARHVFTNLHLQMDADNRASGNVILTLYACDGEPPYPSVPILVADYNDIYVQNSAGEWKYQSRQIIPVFGGIPNLAGKSEKS